MRRLFSPGLQKNARKDNPINFSSFGVGARSAAIRNRISRNVFTANRGVNFTAGPPTVGIEPVTSEEVLVLVQQGDTETFDLTLNKPPLNATRIELKSSNPLAISFDKQVVEFNRSNWATPVTITATALINSPTTTIELSPLYSSFKKLINVRGASVAISSTNVILSEGENSDITIDLDDPVTNVTMNIQNNDTTNFQLDKTTLSFTSNSLSQTFNVTALRDYKVLSDITSSLIVSVAAGSDNGYLSMTPKTIDLTHVNIDTASMSVSPTTVALDEGNSSSIQVSLGTKPTTDVFLDVVLSDTTNFSIDTSSLTFIADSGPNQNQTITVNAIRDYKEMANIHATLTVSVLGTSATEYIGLSSQTVSLVHQNIDTADLTTNLGSLSFELNEGENTSFDVSLATIPVTDVSLAITVANDKLTASPTTVYFDSTNWNVASPITLTANSDLVVSDEVIEVSMNVVSTSSTEYQGKNVVLQVTYKDVDTHPVTCVSPTSVVNVISGNYMFNGETSHDPTKKYGLYEGPYTFESVPQGHPIAFLNQSVPGVSYSVVDDNPIIINIEGGDVAPNANGDYYTFTDEAGNTLDIANGSFKFMRGRTYKFREKTGSGIDSNNPLKIIHTDGINEIESDVIQGTEGVIVTIPTTQATSINALRYKNMNTNGSVTANMSLTYKQAQDGNSYDYFYGNVSVQVQPNFLGYLSVECYNHGYMGGQDLFVYDDACAP